MKTTVHFHISLYFLCTVILLAFFGCSKKITNNHPPKFSFTRSSQSFDAVNTHQIALGDLDGDGDLDAVFASFNHGRVLLNDGSGNFTDTGQLLARYGHGVEIGDLDRDGDLDIFMINNNLQLNERSAMVYFNDGAGLFEDSGQDLGDSERNGLGVQLIDIDNDNDLDAHVNYNQGESILYMNNGEGVFQKSEQVCPSGT